jgi:hypothetical protein
MESNLQNPVRLCDEKGNLNPEAVGWSRHPLHICNLCGHWLRKKRWNFWTIADDCALFCITLASLDYIETAFTFFLDYETKEFHEKSILMPFGNRCRLPETVWANASLQHPQIQVEMCNTELGTRLETDCPHFHGNPLRARLFVQHPPECETLNIVIPWSKRRYQFTTKMAGVPANGYIQLGGKTHRFNPETAFGCLDFGRGVWKYSTAWNWAAMGGKVNGLPVGVNLGAKWTDGTGINENAIFYDGKVYKLREDVQFEFDKRDLMKAWKVRTIGSKAVDLTLTPFFQRTAKTNLLIVNSSMQQLIGKFEGTLMIDGSPLHIDSVIGWVEDHAARW